MSSRAKLLSEGCFKDDRGEVQVDTEWAARLALVFSIRPVLIEIGDTNEILFFAVKTSSGWEGMRCMPLGRKLLFALRADTLDSFEIFSDCNLNPYFESFRSIARKHAFFGMVNVVVWRTLAERQRRELAASQLLCVDGTIETRDGVLHVVAGRLEDISELLQGLNTRSRDFHLCKRRLAGIQHFLITSATS